MLFFEEATRCNIAGAEGRNPIFKTFVVPMVFVCFCLGSYRLTRLSIILDQEGIIFEYSILKQPNSFSLLMSLILK